MTSPLNPNPGQTLPVFGSLEDSVRQLTQRLDAMMARDPAKEFAIGESNVGVNYNATSFQNLELFTLPKTGADSIFRDEFSAQLYPRNLHIHHRLTSQAVNGGSYGNIFLNTGLMFDFYKDLRGGNGMGTKPDSSFFVPYNHSFIETNFVPATGVESGLLVSEINADIPVRYRHVQVSLFDTRLNLRRVNGLTAYFGAAVADSTLILTFMGD